MSHSAKFHGRFWEAMRARFGIRWVEAQGVNISEPWIALLDRFTESDVRKALEIMGQDPKRIHPPNLPEFENYVRRASDKRGDGTDYVRTFWQSVATSTCMRDAALHGIVEWGASAMHQLPQNVRDVMIPACNQLVEDACRRESEHGPRRTDEERHMNRELWNALKAFRTDKVPPLRGESTALHFQD
jgi:hypothetical protein